MSQSAERTALDRPALVLFGNDPANQPRAGWFTPEERETAERASGDLDYIALRVATAADQAWALGLPRGRLSADGLLEVPLLPPELFQTLRILILRDLSRPAATPPPLSPHLASPTLLPG